MATRLITDSYESSQEAVAARIDEILDACTVKDFQRLAAYHLDGPKSTKFDDVEPFDRQDAFVAMRSEIEQFGALEYLGAAIYDLKD
jgi:hypothetical protein